MKFKILISVFIFSFFMAGFSYALTGEEIINKLDENMTFSQARLESKLIIHIGDEIRTKEFFSFGQGRDKTYAEFTSPPRDKGVKYLKIADNMWMYLPSVDKTIKIAGHMLRQSMMGSDFSYEDALESSKLLDKYTARLAGEETVLVKSETEKNKTQRLCFVVELVAKVKDVTYYKRRIFVDQEYFIPVREELFALSGKKLKVMTSGNVQKFGRRYYPMYFTLSNLLRQNSLTEMLVTRAEFDLPVAERVFTLGYLTK